MWASRAKLIASDRHTTQTRWLARNRWSEEAGRGDGWLIAGSSEGRVGVIWVAEKGEGASGGVVAAGNWNGISHKPSLFKSHLNLVAHFGKVEIVRVHPNGNMLASYDSWGKVVVWKNALSTFIRSFEIELPFTVSDMQFCPTSYSLLVCTPTGQVMKYSMVHGMIQLSVQLEPTHARQHRPELTCCSWTKTGEAVALGCQQGDVIIIWPNSPTPHFTTLSLSRRTPVRSVQWYGPVIETCQSTQQESFQAQRLSTYFSNGRVIILQSFSSRECVSSFSGVYNGTAEWNSSGTLLALAGYQRDGVSPIVRFMDSTAHLLYSLVQPLPFTPGDEAFLHSISWSQGDSVLILSWGGLYSMDVHPALPSLQFLCRRAIEAAVEKEQEMEHLPLPAQEVQCLKLLKEPMVSPPFDLCNLFKPLPQNIRVHCIIEHGLALSQRDYGNSFSLSLEYLNQYVPLLQATRKPLNPRHPFHMGFKIRAVSQPGCSQSYVSSTSEEDLAVNPPRRRSLRQQLLSAFRPRYARVESHGSRRRERAATCLASTSGSLLSHQFKFKTTSPNWAQGSCNHLGSLSIHNNSWPLSITSPRDIHVHLPIVMGDGEMVTLQTVPPRWNTQSLTFSLDFGARVNRTSEKNFQLNHHGTVALQTGRFNNHFTLDFQWPFSPIQAFCVALSGTGL